MKSLLLTIAAISLISQTAAAFSEETLLNCTATEIYNDGVFEESLSLEEYPELLVKGQNEAACAVCPAFSMQLTKITIGSSVYKRDDTADYYKLAIDYSTREEAYVIKYAKYGITYSIVPNKVNDRVESATIYYTKGKMKAVKVADFRCSNP